MKIRYKTRKTIPDKSAVLCRGMEEFNAFVKLYKDLEPNIERYQYSGSYAAAIYFYKGKPSGWDELKDVAPDIKKIEFKDL